MGADSNEQSDPRLTQTMYISCRQANTFDFYTPA